jgi:helix-hairpin-helix protein
VAVEGESEPRTGRRRNGRRPHIDRSKRARVSEPLGDSPPKRTSGSSQSGCSAVGVLGRRLRARACDPPARRSTCSAWMRTRARRRHAAGSDTAPRRAGSLRESLLAREGGIGRTADGFGGLVDVNSASVEEFAQLPGISLEIGRRVVEVRERIDGFDSVLDFASLLDLPPRFVDGLRDRLVCLTRLTAER